jgi:hypothetical protein
VRVSHGAVVAALRAVASGRTPDPAALAVASSLGFVHDGRLTAAGQRLVEDGLLKRNDVVVKDVLRDALMQLPATKVLVEGQWGLEMDRGHVAEVLAYAHPESRSWAPEDLGRFLLALNEVGLITYSKKTGRVLIRGVAPPRQPDPLGSLVSPTTPFRNKLLMVDLVARARKSLWWFDAHLDRKALRFIWDEASLAKLTDIRILTCGRGIVDAATLDDYQRCRDELAKRGCVLEWRTLLDRDELNDKHDRWLCPDGAWWNVPPFSAVMTGKYGSLLKDLNIPPFDEWWARGTEITVVRSGP